MRGPSRSALPLIRKVVLVIVAGSLVVAACGGGEGVSSEGAGGLSSEEQQIAEDWADVIIRDATDGDVTAPFPRVVALCATERIVGEFGAEKSRAYVDEIIDLAATENDVVYPEADARVIAKNSDDCIDWDAVFRTTFADSELTDDQLDCVVKAFVDNAEELQYRDLAGLDDEDVIDFEQLEIDCRTEG